MNKSKYYFDQIKQIFKTQQLQHQTNVLIFDLKLASNNYSMVVRYREKNDKDQKILYFIQVGTDRDLTLVLDEYFGISINLPKIEQEIKNFFQITATHGKNSNRFVLKNLFLEIETNMRLKSDFKRLKRTERAQICGYKSSDGLYYKSSTDWSVSPSGKHHTQANHDKVEVLLPQLFKIIYDQDISIGFTDKQTGETNRIQADFDQYHD